MGIEAISNSDFERMHAATVLVTGNEELRAASGLDDMRLRNLEEHVRDAAIYPYSFWHGIHYDRRLFPGLLGVYITSGMELPKSGTALPLLLKQRLPEGDDRRFAFSGVNFVELKGSRRKHQMTVQYADSGMWSYSIRGSEWAHHSVALKDLRSKKDVLKFDVGIRSRKIDDGTPNMTLTVGPGPDHSGEFKGDVVGKVDVRLDSVQVPLERASRSTFGYAFRMEESSPSRLLTVRPFGYMHTVAFLHSASMFIGA